MLDLRNYHIRDDMGSGIGFPAQQPNDRREFIVKIKSNLDEHVGHNLAKSIMLGINKFQIENV